MVTGGGGGFTPGPVSFVRPGGFEDQELMRHEYGHYLQYKRDGGWGMTEHLLEGGVGRDGGNFECETGQLSRDYFHPE